MRPVLTRFPTRARGDNAARRAGAVVLCGLLLTVWPADLAAQFALRSKIEGTITDSTGSALPGATITLTETSRNQVQVGTSDAPGAFAFSNLATGVYTVSATLTAVSEHGRRLQSPAPAVGRPVGLGGSMALAVCRAGCCIVG